MKKILETERLILREYVQADFDGLYAILSDAETMKHYPKPYDEKGTQRWLDWSLDNYQRYGFGLWAIELKSTGEFIGDCGITMQNIDGESLPEIGYHINKAHWRMGYAKEAASAVRDWFFANTDFDSVYSYMNRTNVASYSTAASVGMKRIKEYTDIYGDVCFVYRITREEHKNAKTERTKTKLKTTDAGYINKNNQKNLGYRGVSETHYNQRFFEMECLDCGHKYMANGCDVWLRKCPVCVPTKDHVAPITKQRTAASVHKSSRVISDKLRYKVLKRDNFKCCACGASPAKDPSVELHIDHIVPWSKGGETTLENLQTLCSKCNLGKSDFQ